MNTTINSRRARRDRRDPYARAREDQPTIDSALVALELVNQPPGELKRFAVAVRRVARRAHWRRLGQMRCSKLAAALAAGARALGAAYAGRERLADKSWHLRAISASGEHVVAIVLVAPPIHGVGCFGQLIHVRVLRPDLTNVPLLSTKLDALNTTWGRDADGSWPLRPHLERSGRA